MTIQPGMRSTQMLYELLEREVIPEFYDRNEQGIPTAWVARMRKSMAPLTPQYSAVRSVREYTQQHYVPAAKAYRQRVAFNGEQGTSIVNWRRSLKEKWGSLKFGKVQIASDASQHHFEVDVFLNGLDPNFVRVELYADSVQDADPVRQEMTRAEPLGRL